MFRKLSIAGAAFAMAATSVLGAAPAAAQYHGGYYQGSRYDNRYDQRGYDGYRDGRRYDQRGYAYRDRYYRNDYRRCRDDGTAGTIIGAIAGGLLGNSIAGRDDRAAGTIIGGVGGALAGRAIDRSDSRCYR